MMVFPHFLALATLGFEVEAVGRPAQGQEHPNLNALDVDFQQLGPDDPFAAICCLSGLPSVGDDAGDPWEADAASLAHLRTLLSDGGVMVLALPMGAAVERGRALYDKPRLEALLDGWQLDERNYMREALPGTWMRTAAPEDSAVALVRASVG